MPLAVVGMQHCLDTLPDARVRAMLVKIAAVFSRINVEKPVEQLQRYVALVTPGIHCPLISANRNARDLRHARLTVISDTSRQSAISSIVQPP